jgi:uncharacterized YccA/Bax inhibitor family protein
MQSGNPALNLERFTAAGAVRSDTRMTVQGAVNKTAILLLLLVVAASYTWSLASRALTGAGGGEVMVWVIGGAIGAFIVAIVTAFKAEWSPVTAPIYAVLEGLFLGGISAFFQAQYGGIVFQAVFLTFAVMLAMLALYRTGVIRVTDKFRTGVIAATFGVMLFYLVSFIVSLFGVSLGYRWDGSLIGIGVTLVIVGIAALNLVLDFDTIQEGAASGAPRYMEWYAAFGLMVTLVWLYIEILRLLYQLRRRLEG